MKVLVLAVCFSTPAFAQSALSGPGDIEVPEGHKLVEIPAEYKTASKPILEPTVKTFVTVPGIYRHAIVDGVRRREIVQAPGLARRLVVGPLRTETVRMITYPKSYVLQDTTGRIVKRFRWVRGKLTEV